MSSIKERPILFSGPMVRAILRGKTQTRRAIKRQPGPSCCIEDGVNGEGPFVYSQLGGDGPGHEVTESRTPCICPYGQPGDRLWVRETWGLYDASGMPYDYPSGIPQSCPSDYHVSYPADDSANIIREVFKWKPSIHMPRWVSRILLENASIRAERLQNISEEDAIAEGVERISSVGPMRAFGWRDYSGGPGFFDPIKSYKSLWESINGQGSWNANPWVWAVEFKVVEGRAD